MPKGPSVTLPGGRQVVLGDPRGPSELQQLFIQASEREQLIGGAKRGGKSVALCQKAIMLSLAFPGNRGYLLRQDLTDLRESLLVTFFQICPPELVLNHHHTYRNIQLRTGSHASTIIYSGLSDETREESSKGKESGWFAVDEPSEIDFGTYLMYLAQLCWRLPGGAFPPYMALLGSNPEPGWVEERFKLLIEETSNERPVARKGDKVFIRALPRDNPYLPPGWERAMRKDAPGVWIKKYLDGSWEVSEGQVFKEFDRSVHVLPSLPVDFMKRLKLVGSLDHATTGTTCFCFDGIDPDGNVFDLGPYYAENRLISEHAKAISNLADLHVNACGRRELVLQRQALDRSIYAAFHAFEYQLIDPSTQAKTLQNRNDLWSVQDEYRRNGIPTQPAWNAVEAGINLFQEYLHVRPDHIHPLTGQRGSPRFFLVGERNPGIKELIGYRKIISDAGIPKYTGADHWIDNQRYILMSRPEPPAQTNRDYLSLDTATRKAQRAMQRFDKTFGDRPDQGNQWFPGGSANVPNTWWPERIN